MKLDVAALATAAMQQFDKNKDGAISAAEADASPALKSAFQHWDADHNGKVSEKEVAEQISSWTKYGASAMRFNCVVRSGGSGLSAVSMVLKPEAFLESALKPASGVSNQYGEVPLNSPGQTGVTMGLYRIELTGGSTTLPAKFNTNSTIGVEVSPANPILREGLVIDVAK